jgi:ATP-dependent RNA helicase DDX55/SPB4
MTDADAMSELVRAGLRNPARIVVKVQSKRTTDVNNVTADLGDEMNDRRIPSGCVHLILLIQLFDSYLHMS